MVVRMLSENELFGEEDIVLDYYSALQRVKISVKSQEGSNESKNNSNNNSNFSHNI